MKTMKQIVIIASLLLLSIKGFGQTPWTSMGASEVNQLSYDGAVGTQVAIDSSGTPYVAYIEDYGLTVMKFSNGTWTKVGNSGIVDTGVGQFEMALSPSGMPYVVYNNGNLNVMKYNGTSWVSAGASAIYQGGVYSTPDIAIDASGQVFVSFIDSGFHVAVIKYGGSSWSMVGSAQASLGTVSNSGTLIAVDRVGTPYLTFVLDSLATPVVERFNGTSWIGMSTPALGNGQYAIGRITIAPSGQPYMQFNTLTSSFQNVARVAAYNGSSWVDIDSLHLSFYTAMDHGMAFDPSGNIYLSVVDTTHGYQYYRQNRVLKYNGSAWAMLGSSDFGGPNFIGSIALGTSGDVYLACGFEKSELWKYNGSIWSVLGNQGISDVTAYGANIISDNTGNAYMAYGTLVNGIGRVSVSRYSGNTWVPVGNISTTGPATQPIVALDDQGMPYVCYMDSLSNAHVKSYNGSSWVDVGSPISLGVVDYYNTPLALKISHSGTPYLSFIDRGNNVNERARIVYYNGSSWNYLDTLGFNPSGVNFLSFDFDPHDTIYVAYTDSPNYAINVLKYNGTSWSYIDSANISQAYYLQVAVDLQGNPYLLYTDSDMNSNMVKYRGGVRSFVGNPAFGRSAYYNSFALNQSGQPYVIYTDGSDDYKAKVMTYNGSAWVDMGLENVVLESSNATSISIAPTGALYAAFSDYGIWGYVSYTSPDSTVWPGDADANHIVDNTDLLTIGLAYDSTGPVRAVQGIVWQADQAINWNDSFSVYAPAVNFKHADCNGDGIINSADTVAIMANYSLTHAKTGPMLAPWRNGIPAIKAVVSPDTAYTGDTLTVSFVVGDTNTTVNNLYGLAFTYNYDPRVMDSTYTPTMGFLPTSWIGTPSQKISINKILPTTGQIQAAVTRINHTSVSGHGAIATATFKITTDNISGKNYSYYTNKWSITDVIAIDQYGDPIPLNASADSSTVGFYPNGIREVTTETLHIQPNPAHDKVLVSAGNTIREISLSNIMGQQVMDNNTANSKTVNMDVSGLESGVYVVQVKTDKGTGIAKLIIEK